MFNANIFIVLFGLLNFVSNSYVNANCVGKYITMPEVKERHIFPITMNMFTEYPATVTLENNGQTVIVSCKFDGELASIEDGPFGNETFIFHFAYYHWLNSSNIEKEKNNEEFPAELHAVFVNSRFQHYEEAVKKNFGVVITAHKYRIISDDRVGKAKIVHAAIEKILTPNMKHEIRPPHVPYLYYLIDIDFIYKMYVGKSLFNSASSHCGGDVVWLHFDRPIGIQKDDVAVFRKLMSYNNAPLMSKINQFSAPNSIVYQTIDYYEYREKNLTAKNFEGYNFIYDTASNYIITKKFILLIMTFIFIINSRRIA